MTNRWSVSRDSIFGAELAADHPAKRVLAGDATQIFLASPVAEPERVAWRMREEFERAGRGYAEFWDCFNDMALLEVLRSGYGLIATGPDFLLDQVAAVLDDAGATHSRLASR